MFYKIDFYKNLLYNKYIKRKEKSRMSDILIREIRKETFNEQTLDFSNYFTLAISNCHFHNCHIIIKNIPGFLKLTFNEYENCTFDFDFSNVAYRDRIVGNDRRSYPAIQEAIDAVYKPLFKISDELIGYKLLKDELGEVYLAKLSIPKVARKVSPFNSKKCRASKATVLSIKKLSSGAEYSEILHHCFNHLGENTIYKTGSVIYPRDYNPNYCEECTSGIHFYLTIEDLIEDFIPKESNHFWDNVKASLLAKRSELV